MSPCHVPGLCLTPHHSPPPESSRLRDEDLRRRDVSNLQKPHVTSAAERDGHLMCQEPHDGPGPEKQQLRALGGQGGLQASWVHVCTETGRGCQS